MEKFVKYIVQNLVDNPDEVEIKEVQGTNTLILELRAAQEDYGKIIGKKGKTITAIRTLVMAVASRNKIHVTLEIVEGGNKKPEKN